MSSYWDKRHSDAPMSPKEAKKRVAASKSKIRKKEKESKKSNDNQKKL